MIGLRVVNLVNRLNTPMKIWEVETKPATGWEKAQADAAAHGMRLIKEPYAKGYRLEPENYQELAKNLESKGFNWRDYRGLLVKSVNKLTDYKTAVNELQKNLGPVDKIADTLRKEKSTEAYKTLQSMQEHSLQYWPHNRLQLFMPRPQVHKFKRSGSWIYNYDDEGNLRETRPVLTGATADSPPGRNKPGNCFWTSSMKPAGEQGGKKYYTSEWVNWVIGNQSDWWSPKGYVYKISSNARILALNSTQDAYTIYRLYAELGSKVDLQKLYGEDEAHYAMMRDFPWQDIRKHWDGVNHHGGSDRYGFTYGWDCESTEWFNTDVLTFVGEVSIIPPDLYLDDED